MDKDCAAPDMSRQDTQKDPHTNAKRLTQEDDVPNDGPAPDMSRQDTQKDPHTNAKLITRQEGHAIPVQQESEQGDQNNYIDPGPEDAPTIARDDTQKDPHTNAKLVTRDDDIPEDC